MSNEIQKKPEAPITQIRALLESKKTDLAMAIPKHLTVDRLLRVCLTACNKTPKLMECTRESLLACVMDCASLGLEPDAALGRAYLIPFFNSKLKSFVCTLVVGYKGLLDLAYRSGMVDSLDAFAVHDNDVFGLTLGSHPQIEHVPEQDDPGAFKGAYAVARLKGSSIPKFVYMSKAEIESIRLRSKAADSGPWVTDYEEMAKKTCVRRLSKMLPLSVEFGDAISKDQEYDLDIAPRQVEVRKAKIGERLFAAPEAQITMPPVPEPEIPEVESEKAPEATAARPRPTMVEEPAPAKAERPVTERLMLAMAQEKIDPADALSWLKMNGWITDGQGFGDIEDDESLVLVNNPAAFSKNVQRMKNAPAGRGK